jgi:fatty acid desaturase
MTNAIHSQSSIYPGTRQLLLTQVVFYFLMERHPLLAISRMESPMRIVEKPDNVLPLGKAHRHTVQAMSRKSLFPWVPHVILDWSMIAAAFVFAGHAHNALGYMLAVLVIGNRQHALAVLGHDGTHFTLHANRKINDFLSNIFCFWPMLITVEGYRKLHFTHHRETGTAQDPELMHKAARAPQWDLPLKKEKLSIYAAKDLVGYSVPDLLIILMFSRPEKKSLMVAPIALNVIGSASLTAFGFWWVPVMWYVSMATSFMMFFRFRLWLEHQGTGDTQRVNLNWWQRHLLAPHNIWLHWEHHEWPTVPYHRLPAARALATHTPVLSLAELMQQLEQAPSLPSGIALKEEKAKAA